MRDRDSYRRGLAAGMHARESRPDHVRRWQSSRVFGLLP
jgi:hypothetical protein